MAALDFEMLLQDKNLLSKLSATERRIMGFSDKAVKEFNQVEEAYKHIGSGVAGALAFTELAQLPGKIAQVRGEFQQLEISFQTMLGSKLKADKLMTQLVDFAAKTPYGLKDTASGAKQLLAYGESAENVTKTLTRLGDIASGINAPLNDIVYLYGTTMTQGRLYTQDLNQFTGRGIPMIKELAKQFGVADSEVKGLVESGKVGFPQVQKVIESLTAKGSMFGGLMEAQSQSIVGLQAQFSDALDAMFNDLGRSQEGAISSTIKAGTAVVENYKDVLDVLKVLVLTYGSYRAALIAVSAVQAIPAIVTSVQTFASLALSVRSAGDAMAFLSLTTKASPLGAALGIVALLGSAYAVYGGKLNEAQKAQERMNEAALESEKSLNGEIAKVAALRQQITDNTKSVEERNAKLKDLVALNPKVLSAITLQNAATSQGTQAIEEYIRAKKEQLRVDRIQAQMTENLNSISDIQGGKRDDDFKPSLKEGTGLALASIYGGADMQKQASAIAKRNKEQAIKELQDYNKGLADQINNGIEQRRALRNKETSVQKEGIKKTAEYYDEEIKALKEKQAKEATTLAQSRAFDNKIAELERKKRAITGNLSPEEKKAQKEATRLAKEEADKRVKTYQEELSEKRDAYTLYEKWVQNYGEETAKDQFSKLISNGKDYVDYLEREIKRLDAVRSADSLTTQEQFDLSGLISERDNLLGKKSPLDEFIKGLDQARDSSQSLTEELEFLRKKQSELSPDDNSSTGLGMKQAVAERLVEVERARHQMLTDYLTSVSGSEQRETSIRKQYSDMRNELDEKSADKKAEAYIKALTKINQAEKDDLNDDKSKASLASKEYDAFQELAEKHYSELKKLDIKNARDQFAIFSEGLDKQSKEYKKAKEDLLEIENGYQQKRLDIINTIAGAASELGQIFATMDGSIGNVGTVMVGAARELTSAANAIGNLTKKSDNGGSFDITKITSIVSLITQAIGLVVAGAKRIKDAQRQYDTTVHDFWQGRAIDENEAFGSDTNRNPFYTDYDSMAQAGIKQYEDALTKYNQSISKLSDGKAITGFRGGFFRKDKNVYGDLLQIYPELVDSAGNLNVALAKTLVETNAVSGATKLLLEDSIAWEEQVSKSAQKIEDIVSSLVGQIGNNLTDAMVTAFQNGEDAAASFGESVGDVIGGIIKQTILLKFLQPALDRLKKETEESLSPTGDKNLVDDLERYKDYGLPGYIEGMEYIADVAKWGKDNGLGNIFGSEDKPSSGSALAPQQGVVSGASQESINLLNGGINAMRISTVNIEQLTITHVGLSRSALFELTGIKQNTNELYAIRQSLDRIDRLLSTDFLRAIGG